MRDENIISSGPLIQAPAKKFDNLHIFPILKHPHDGSINLKKIVFKNVCVIKEIIFDREEKNIFKKLKFSLKRQSVLHISFFVYEKYF